jgi:predicted dinucleotide-binding enzyme
MKIGIIGAGNIGGTLGLKWAKAGHTIMFASRNPNALAPLAQKAGPAAMTGTPEDAARFGEAILMAAPFKAWPELVDSIEAFLKGKTVIDASNTYLQRDGAIAQLAIDQGQGSGAFVQALLPRARIVKAFNTLYYKVLEDQGGQGIGLAIAGDNQDAIALVQELTKDAGFIPVVAGPLARAKNFDPGTPVYAKAMPANVLATALGVSLNP